MEMTVEKSMEIGTEEKQGENEGVKSRPSA